MTKVPRQHQGQRGSMKTLPGRVGKGSKGEALAVGLCHLSGGHPGQECGKRSSAGVTGAEEMLSTVA